MARTLIENYGNRLHRTLAAPRAEGVLPSGLGIKEAAALFLGMVQGLAMQRFIHGGSARVRADALRVWVIYRAGLLAGATTKEGGA